MSKIRVMLADDHAVLRAGLRLLVESQVDMEVVGECGDFLEAERLLAALRPDVLLLDLTMPHGQGLKAIESFARQFLETRILVLTMHDDPAFMRRSLAIGAAGYVAKHAADTELLNAVRAVFAGGVYVNVRKSEGQTGKLPISTAAALETGMKTLPRLSAREMQVMELVVEGHTNQVIADRLNVGIKSVESYRARLMAKLGLRTRAEIIQYASTTGMLSQLNFAEGPPGHRA